MNKITIKNGFTMLEVIISIVVMSSMLVGMLSMVSYGMKAWQVGQGKLNASNYNRMTHELLKKQFMAATDINLDVLEEGPAVGIELNFTNMHGDSHDALLVIATGSVPATNNILFAKVLGSGGFSTLNTTDIDDGTANTLFSRHYNMALARKVMNFRARRPTSYTVEISLQLGEYYEDEFGLSDQLQTVSSQTMLFLTPGVN